VVVERLWAHAEAMLGGAGSGSGAGPGGGGAGAGEVVLEPSLAAFKLEAAADSAGRRYVVGRCRLNPVEACVESAWFQRSKLKHDEPLSHVAFNFNLRPYKMGNNFGQPHRDYTYADVHGAAAAASATEENEQEQAAGPSSTPPGVVSVWLPLVDVTLNSGCMYVVPKSGDADGGRGLNSSTFRLK